MEVNDTTTQVAKSKWLKQHLRPLLLKALLHFSSWMPLSLAHLFGSCIGRLAIRIKNNVSDTACVNLSRCFPQMNIIARSLLHERYMIETGKTLMESGAMWMWPGKTILNKVRHVEGEELVQDAIANGRGVIFAIPHLGSWEMVGLYCSSRYPMTSLYRPVKIIALDAIIRHGRERLGAKLVPTDTGGVKALLAALNRGETIGILPDQEPGSGQGEFAPFFDIPAYSMTLLSRLAQKTGAEVVFTYAERLPWGRGYHLHFLKAPEGIADNELESSVKAVNAGVEACIKECPPQYQWGYRRFKTRPENQAGFY